MGLIEYFVQSNDNADCVDPDMRFKFVDDLSILELVMLGGWLSTYNFKQHVANDIGIDEHFVSADNLKTQGYLNNIGEWTEHYLMVLNEQKTLLNKTLQTCWNSGACTGMHGHSQYLSASILDGWVQISY